MAVNEIQSRIAEELEKIPPFGQIKEAWRLELAKRAKVQYLLHGEEVFKAGQASHDQCYLIIQGQIELFSSMDNQSTLVDLCTAGECFGLRSLITQEAYSLTARVRNEALLYALPTSIMRKIMQEEGSIALHFANMLALRQQNEEQQLDFSEDAHTQYADIDNLPEWVKPSTSLVSCSPRTIIADAAMQMREERVSSILILNEHEWPIGIVTQTDLAHQVATGLLSTTSTVDKLMNAPVKTAKLPLSDEEAALSMLSQGIKHLVITEDGSPNSKALGMVSDRDIQLRQRYSARYLLQRIRRATTLQEWGQLRKECTRLAQQQLDSKVPVVFILRTISFLHQAILNKIIEAAMIEQSLHDENLWCWVNMGSMGRSEQLFPTDQDNAIIHKDGISPDKRKALVHLARKVNADLMECGFEYCPAEMMAGNEKWCLSLSEWKNKFEGWILSPTPKSVMFTTIFFDMQCVYGNKLLLNELQKEIQQLLRKHPEFLSFLAKDALKNPAPLSFLNNLVVEQDGAHKNEFDIKARGLMPFVDAARVLALVKGKTAIVNTDLRLESAGKDFPERKELFQAASKAYHRLLTYRYRQARISMDSGRFIKPDSLDSYDRQLMKQCFSPLKELQSFVRRTFDTDLLPS